MIVLNQKTSCGDLAHIEQETYFADPRARESIERVVKKWIDL